jgi:hypothetical protein
MGFVKNRYIKDLVGLIGDKNLIHNIIIPLIVVVFHDILNFSISSGFRPVAPGEGISVLKNPIILSNFNVVT